MDVYKIDFVNMLTKVAAGFIINIVYMGDI